MRQGNLFLRKRSASCQERRVKPRRADNLTLVLLSHRFNWRDSLTAVRPKTLVAWHRKGFCLFWRWKSKAGRRPIPAALQHLIRKMACENPSWGEERNRKRAAAKARSAHVAAYNPEVPAEVAGRAARWTSERSAPGSFSQESRQVHNRLKTEKVPPPPCSPESFSRILQRHF